MKIKMWAVIDKHGKMRRYKYGYGLQEYAVPTKKEAVQLAKRLAEREYELASKHLITWGDDGMPFDEVKKMGYRIVRAELEVRAAKGHE